jgi:hypothetical protein
MSERRIVEPQKAAGIRERPNSELQREVGIREEPNSELQTRIGMRERPSSEPQNEERFIRRTTRGRAETAADELRR